MAGFEMPKFPEKKEGGSGGGFPIFSKKSGGRRGGKILF